MAYRVNAVPVKRDGRVVMIGNVYDGDGQLIASFPSDGLDYIDWFAQIDDDTQLDIVSNQLAQNVVPWLLKTSGVQI